MLVKRAADERTSQSIQTRGSSLAPFLGFSCSFDMVTFEGVVQKLKDVTGKSVAVPVLSLTLPNLVVGLGGFQGAPGSVTLTMRLSLVYLSCRARHLTYLTLPTYRPGTFGMTAAPHACLQL
jgi:hypothetical protein